MRFYGLDLRELVHTESIRRLHALTTGLPPEAATWREESPSWRLEHELAAMQVEVLDRWLRIIYLVLAAQIPRDHRPVKTLPDPLDIRHPDRPERAERKPKPETDAATIMAFFQNSIGRQRGGKR